MDTPVPQPTPHLGDVFLARLQSDPSAVMNPILQRLTSRTKGVRDYHLWQQILGLQYALSRLEEPSAGTWSALAEDCRLAHIYAEVVKTDGFFHEEKSLVASVLCGIARLTNFANNKKAIDVTRFLLSHCADLFEEIWNHREQLMRLTSAHPTVGKTYHPAMQCTIAFFDLHYSILRTRPGIHTHIPQMILFGWASLGDFYALDTLRKYTNSTPWDEVDRFVEDVVVGIIGGSALFVRLEQLLQNEHEDEDVVTALGIMVQLAKYSSIRLLLHERETFKHIVSHLNRTFFSREVDATGRKNTWNKIQATYMIYHIVFEDFVLAYNRNDVSAIAFRGQDASLYLSLVTRWTARQVYREGLACRSDIELLYKTASGGLALQESLLTEIDEHPVLKPYMDAFFRRLRTEWAPTVDMLRAGLIRTDEQRSEGYESLCDTWFAFGPKYGWKETAEGSRGPSRCSYIMCPFSTRKPTGALSTCKGCGKASYCGKECQRGDWKIHKRVCGNRLK